jgi:hypothetical protein
MILLDDWLFKLYQQGVINFDNMMQYCKDQAFLQRKVAEAGGQMPVPAAESAEKPSGTRPGPAKPGADKSGA